MLRDQRRAPLRELTGPLWTPGSQITQQDNPEARGVCRSSSPVRVAISILNI